MSIMLRI